MGGRLTMERLTEKLMDEDLLLFIVNFCKTFLFICLIIFLMGSYFRTN